MGMGNLNNIIQRFDLSLAKMNYQKSHTEGYSVDEREITSYVTKIIEALESQKPTHDVVKALDTEIKYINWVISEQKQSDGLKEKIARVNELIHPLPAPPEVKTKSEIRNIFEGHYVPTKTTVKGQPINVYVEGLNSIAKAFAKALAYMEDEEDVELNHQHNVFLSNIADKALSKKELFDKPDNINEKDRKNWIDTLTYYINLPGIEEETKQKLIDLQLMLEVPKHESFRNITREDAEQLLNDSETKPVYFLRPKTSSEKGRVEYVISYHDGTKIRHAILNAQFGSEDVKNLEDAIKSKVGQNPKE